MFQRFIGQLQAWGNLSLIRLAYHFRRLTLVLHRQDLQLWVLERFYVVFLRCQTLHHKLIKVLRAFWLIWAWIPLRSSRCSLGRTSCLPLSFGCQSRRGPPWWSQCLPRRCRDSSRWAAGSARNWSAAPPRYSSCACICSGHWFLADSYRHCAFAFLLRHRRPKFHRSICWSCARGFRCRWRIWVTRISGKCRRLRWADSLLEAGLSWMGSRWEPRWAWTGRGAS